MQALAPPLATLFSDTGLAQDDAALLPEQESSSSQSGSDRIGTAPKDSGMPPPAKSSGKARRGRLQCEANAKSGISVRRDPCFVSGISKRCGCPSRFTLRLLRPRSSVNLDLTPSQLQDETVFAYIHVNKAGGQTVKSILMDAIQRGNWSAADLGTYTGWQALRNPALATSVEVIDVFKHPSIEIFSCGDEGTRHALPRPTRIGKCAVRAIWGGLSMGLCDLFPERPCMYFTTLRDPIKRAVSEYNYFCVLGAEHRKKWLPEWRKLGHCPVDIYEYFKMELTVPNFLKLRLTRGCDTKCGVEAAKTNLAHPCVQFLVIEHMKEDMRRFADKLQGPLADAFEAALHEETHINKSELQARTKAQMQNETLMGNLAGLLEDDMVIYNYALTIRDEKWRSPLQACPASM
ncbi:Hypothetical Protein FCC1311_086792 [Hondaea fermentalgiana]|uniref:Uncharacterized protein n=1 Tax=Hondaea fermentalgiana TaxID=2315210 RepID=A0A2R5GWY8_9STRA|nr:Hypothetical Protein FCC1311_086792 [Hondaea fermentalgiana]|eukprot:GBG32454.1 Hypothetical Protein FCC1311_086792 [Hondaea fermentalgiana]